MSTADPNTYDEIPYESKPVTPSHPDRLATEAALFGMHPAAVTECRVLELGCASGGNLLPLAQTLPNSRFLGIDLSPRQVADGQKLVEALGLSNLELRAMSIMDVDDGLGEFDYIVCHGVYSWVPAFVQEKILEICRRNLAPQGVAYVSYNTFPGWHKAGMIREMVGFHARQFPEHRERLRQARAFLNFLADSAEPQGQQYSRGLKEGAEWLREQSDAYFFHEFLEQDNHPIYFHEFIERTTRHQLQYLTEANVDSLLSQFSPKVLKTLDALSPDPIRREQHLDFLIDRTFRRSLLCHAEVALERQPSGEILNQFPFWFSAAALPVSDQPEIDSAKVEEFRTLDNKTTLACGHPLVKAAMACLSASHMRPLSLDGLRSATWARMAGSAWERETPVEVRPQQLNESLLQCYRLGFVDLHLFRAPIVLEPGLRPLASPLARLQASHGGRVTSLNHKQALVDGFDRLLLPLLDGRHDRDQLLERLTEAVKAGDMVPRDAGEPIEDPAKLQAVMKYSLDQSLLKLAHSALLIG